MYQFVSTSRNDRVASHASATAYASSDVGHLGDEVAALGQQVAVQRVGRLGASRGVVPCARTALA